MGYHFTGELSEAPQGCCALCEARRVYERFHGFVAGAIRRSACERKVPDVLVELGDLHAVVYRAERGSRGRPRTFIHFMETPPKLACDPSGRQLYVLGGRYQVTQRGIEG